MESRVAQKVWSIESALSTKEELTKNECWHPMHQSVQREWNNKIAQP
jgi:hypothetical protein